MSSDEEILARHTFQPYMWDEARCGYVDGDDMMCGYPEDAHPLKPVTSTRTREQQIIEHLKSSGYHRDEQRCCWIRGDLVFTDESLLYMARLDI